MYSICIRDHVMIAHSLDGEVFGPAQKLHGATYVVDVELRSANVGREGIVVDIGLASSVLREILEPIGYCNLDDHEDFAGYNTTTEFMARHIYDCYADRIRGGQFGESGRRVESIRVQLQESHVAWAAYEGHVFKPELDE